MEVFKKIVEDYKKGGKIAEDCTDFLESFLSFLYDEGEIDFADDLEEANIKFFEMLKTKDIEDILKNLSKRTYNKILFYMLEEYYFAEYLEETFGITLYENKIQLTDRRVLWEIESENINQDYYSHYILDKKEEFKNFLNKKYELGIENLELLGRGGRHLVIHNDSKDKLNLDLLIKSYSEIQIELNKFIDDIVKELNKN